MSRAARRLLIAGWLAGMLACPALAQQNPAAQGAGPSTSATSGPEAGQPVSNEDLHDLIDRLQDPQERERLIKDLRGLLAARAQAEPSEAQVGEDAVSSLLEAISARTAVVQDVVSSVIKSLDQLPRLGAWLRDRLARPESRMAWLDLGFRIALILGLGLLGYLGTAMPLRPLRARTTHPADARNGALGRLWHLLGWLVLELLPVIGFAVLALIALAALQPGWLVRQVALPLIYAVVVAHGGIALARVAFAPEAPAVRMLPLDDDAARYGFAWARRLIALAAYGFFALEAARRLGLPWTLHGFLLNVLFLALVAVAAVLILRCRRPVANAIARLSGEQHPRALRGLPWPALARIWHLVALAYVLLVYLVWALEVPGGFNVVLRATVGSALVIGATWMVLRLIAAAFPSAKAPSDEDEVVVSVAERRVRRYLPVARIVVRVLVLVIAGLVLLEVWGLGSLRWLASEAGERFSGQLLTVAAIIAATLIVWEIISLLIERSISDTDAEGNLRLSNRTRTLLTIIRNFVLVFLSLIALFLILSELGLNIAPLLAGAGVIGLAIGFGSQRLVQDIITGMFVLLSDTIRVGDVVEVSGRAGVVERVTMRTVALRDYAGSLHTIPYSAIDTVTNFTKDFSFAPFDIRVSYREDVDQVMQVLRELGQEMNRDPYFRRLILEPLDIAGVDQLAESAVIIRARFKTRPLKQWEVGREFNRRVKNRFGDLGIEIPFPHQTIYFGADKQGAAPPARVELGGAPAVAHVPSSPPDAPKAAPMPEPALARPQRE